jgi:hypothetical protein
MKKTALYDNPSGYGHGGLGYHHSLDTLPTRAPHPGQLPAWMPWVGLAGAGVLGALGIRGLAKAFRRAKVPKIPPVDPRAAAAAEMAGMEGSAVQRAKDEALKNIEARGYKISSVIAGLGRIARGE